MASDSNLNNIQKISPSPWILWKETTETDGADETLPQKAATSPETMKLKREDMFIYGCCPTSDEFYLVVCEQCGQRVKPQALLRHMDRRHYKPAIAKSETLNSESAKSLTVPTLKIPTSALSLTRSAPNKARAMAPVMSEPNRSSVTPVLPNVPRSKAVRGTVTIAKTPPPVPTFAVNSPKVSVAVPINMTSVQLSTKRYTEANDRQAVSSLTSTSKLDRVPSAPSILQKSSGSPNVGIRLVIAKAALTPSSKESLVTSSLSPSPASASPSLTLTSVSELTQPPGKNEPPKESRMLSRESLLTGSTHVAIKPSAVVRISSATSTLSTASITITTCSTSTERSKLTASGEKIITPVMAQSTSSVKTIMGHVAASTVSHSGLSSLTVNSLNRSTNPSAAAIATIAMPLSLSAVVITNTNANSNRHVLSVTNATASAMTPYTSATLLSSVSVPKTPLREKMLPCKDRSYDAEKHCGVLVGGLPCTRSLTCKTHSLSQRRAVVGRSKLFDQLLNEHRAAKEQKLQARALAQNESDSKVTGTPKQRAVPKALKANVKHLTPKSGTSANNPPLSRLSSVYSQGGNCRKIFGADRKSTDGPRQLVASVHEHEQTTMLDKKAPVNGGDMEAVAHSTSSLMNTNAALLSVNTYMMRRYAGGIFALDRKADLLRAAFRSAVGEQPQPPAAKKLCLDETVPVVEPKDNENRIPLVDAFEFLVPASELPQSVDPKKSQVKQQVSVSKMRNAEMIRSIVVASPSIDGDVTKTSAAIDLKRKRPSSLVINVTSASGVEHVTFTSLAPSPSINHLASHSTTGNRSVLAISAGNVANMNKIALGSLASVIRASNVHTNSNSLLATATAEGIPVDVASTTPSIQMTSLVVASKPTAMRTAQVPAMFSVRKPATTTSVVGGRRVLQVPVVSGTMVTGGNSHYSNGLVTKSVPILSATDLNAVGSLAIRNASGVTIRNLQNAVSIRPSAVNGIINTRLRRVDDSSNERFVMISSVSNDSSKTPQQSFFPIMRASAQPLRAAGQLSIASSNLIGSPAIVSVPSVRLGAKRLANPMTLVSQRQFGPKSYTPNVVENDVVVVSDDSMYHPPSVAHS